MLTQTRQIEIKLYGRLRSLGEGAVLSIDAPADLSVAELRALIEHRTGAELADCAFATADRVLETNEAVPGGAIALLPPVCGG